MKFLAILALFALCAGALAQDDEDDVQVDSPSPAVEPCPPELTDLYRVSRNACIDEIRTNRTAHRGLAAHVPNTTSDDTEPEIEEEEVDEADDAETLENVEDNRSRRNSDSRTRGSRRRTVRLSRRRKQFIGQFRSCLVKKIKDNSIVAELKTTCVTNCAGVNAAKRQAKEEKCVLKKVKQRCPGIVPARRTRAQRRFRHNNINRQQQQD